jgi:hypothetical protein
MNPFRNARDALRAEVDGDWKVRDDLHLVNLGRREDW